MYKELNQNKCINNLTNLLYTPPPTPPKEKEKEKEKRYQNVDCKKYSDMLSADSQQQFKLNTT